MVASRTRIRPVLVLALLTGVSSCNGDKKPVPATSASAPSTSAPVTSVAPSASGRSPPMVVCRAMQVSGKVGFRHGLRIQKGAVLDGKRWLQLEEGATVSVRHATSTREFTLIGPGFVLPCLGGDEDVLLASGGVETIQGAGVRPGAEVRIATPFATLTYGDAAIAIKVSASKLEATITGGEAAVTVMPSNGKEPKPLNARTKKFSVTGKLGAEWVKARVQSCEAAAAKAEAQARLVIAKPAADSDAGSLGERASVHVRLRGAARLECLSARAAVVALGDEEAQKELEKRLDEADLQRTRVPTP